GGFAAESLADIDTAADRAAIAGAGPRAKLARLENDSVDVVLGQFERSRQPGISATDDRDACRSRQVGQLSGGWLVSLPPIRGRGKIPMEDVRNHRPAPGARSSRTGIAAPFSRLSALCYGTLKTQG